MRCLIFGSTGGIGGAIKEKLASHDLVCPHREIPVSVANERFDWIIFAQGFMGEEDIKETFFVNTITPIVVTHNFLPKLTGLGGIIYVSSTAALNGNSEFPIYSASKAALNIYCRSMAKKHRDHAFYALCPGPTDTKMWQGLGLEGVAQKPAKVAQAVLKIMAGEFKSGDIIVVRNGITSCERSL